MPTNGIISAITKRNTFANSIRDTKYYQNDCWTLTRLFAPLEPMGPRIILGIAMPLLWNSLRFPTLNVNQHYLLSL